MFLAARDDARRRGDWGVYRAMSVELDQLGYTERETTAVVAPERATPPSAGKRRGRPPRPRCEHGQIVGRCVACDEEED